MPEKQSMRPPGQLRGGDLLKLLAALLTAIGLGSVTAFFKNRTRKQAAEAPDEQAAQANAIEQQRARGHESSDVKLGGILLVAVVLVAVVAGAALGLGELFRVLNDRAAQDDAAISPLFDTHQVPPEPREQADLAQSWAALRATNTAILNSYGRSGDTIRIPIDRAIDLLAQRGLPARASGAPDHAYDQSHELESAGGQPDAVTPVPLGQSSGRPAPLATATAQPTAVVAGRAP